MNGAIKNTLQAICFQKEDVSSVVCKQIWLQLPWCETRAAGQEYHLKVSKDKDFNQI